MNLRAKVVGVYSSGGYADGLQRISVAIYQDGAEYAVPGGSGITLRNTDELNLDDEFDVALLVAERAVAATE